MADSYESNGNYNSYNDDEPDFKRKRTDSTNGDGTQSDHEHGDNNDDVKLNQKATDYIRDCLAEKARLEKEFPIAGRLLSNEIETVSKTGRIPSRDTKYADIYKEKPIRVAQKIRVPIKEHPKFNFVGKLLGPKGNSLKRLQEDTLCKMTVLGRNSMRDRAKEEELRASMDPKYAHLNEDLHVEISTIAPPAEAYARIAYAMAELRKYLTPDSNDEIRQEQLRELMENPPPELEAKLSHYKKPSTTAPPSSGRSSYSGYYVYRPAPPTSHPSAPPTSSRSAVPQKQKVYSILEKARSAIDDSYRYGKKVHEDYHAYHPEQSAYDGYSYSHAHAPPSSSRIPYDTVEYEHPDYNRVDYYSHSQSYPVKSTSSTRPGWKAAPTSSSAAPVSSYSSSSRRHDEHLTSSSAHTSSSASKHAYSTREVRYKVAPYSKPSK